MAINVEETLAITKSAHIEKFTKLYNQRTLYNVNNKTMERHGRKNVVINLSNYNLDNEEISVLNKGLNFATASRRIPKERIIFSIE